MASIAQMVAPQAAAAAGGQVPPGFPFAGMAGAGGQAPAQDGGSQEEVARLALAALGALQPLIEQVASQVEPALRQQRERVASGEFQRSAEAASNALGAGITGVLNQASTLPAGGCCHGARVRRGGCC